MRFPSFLLFFGIVSCFCNFARASEDLPLWEYGAGVGFIRFEEYPASARTRDLVLPFPTFQYRGEILRADDREGARANLFRGRFGSLQLGGGVLPEVLSSDVSEREGMSDIPWGGQLGPQWVFWPTDVFEVKLGVYQAFLINLQKTETRGYVSEAQFIWHVDQQLVESGAFGPTAVPEGRLAFTLKNGSQDFLATYYDVSADEARPGRPAYSARAGLLSWNVSYVQSVQVQKWGFYVGVNEAHYDISVNSGSPLHRSDRNLSVFAGLTYVLGESEARSIPERETRGLLNRFRAQQEL